MIRNAALQNIVMMLLVRAHKRFGRDGVGSPLAAAGNRCLEPSLFNPEDDLRISHPEGICQALYRKQVAPNLAQAEVVSFQHVADRLRCPFNFPRYLFDRNADLGPDHASVSSLADYLVIDPSDFTRSDLWGAEEFQPNRVVSVGIHESELPNRAAHPKS